MGFISRRAIPNFELRFTIYNLRFMILEMSKLNVNYNKIVKLAYFPCAHCG